jgi:hypothetical protein
MLSLEQMIRLNICKEYVNRFVDLWVELEMERQNNIINRLD